MTATGDPPIADQDRLDRSALSGAAWSAVAKWCSQLVAWGGTIVVARILTPADYGLLSMAGVFLALVLALSEFGIGTSVLTLRELRPEQLRQLNAFALLLGVAGTLLTLLAAFPLGLFFRAPNLPPVLAVVGLTFTISSLQTVPVALLRRALRFRTLAMIELARGLIVPVVTLVGALLGLRYWALALGSVVGALVTTTLTLTRQREGFAWPRTSSLHVVLRFSRDLLVGRLAWITYQNGDFAVAGRRLGEAALGSYTLAWTLANTPIEKVAGMLSDVAPSLFSAVQHDRAALRRYFLNLTELLCLAILPASVGLALVSSDAVSVLLGPKWEGTAAPLALLALYAGARSMSNLYSHVFNATRETRYAMWMSVLLAGLLVPGFIVGSRFGTVGLATAWLVLHPMFSVLVFRRLRRVLDLRVAEYVQSLRLGVDGTGLMVAIVLGFQWFLAQTWPAGIRLAVSILLGATTFTLATWMLHRSRLRQIIGWLRRIRKGTPAEA